MKLIKDTRLLAVFFTLALHALVFSLASNNQFRSIDKPDMPKAEEKIVFLELLPPPPERNSPEPPTKPPP